MKDNVWSSKTEKPGVLKRTTYLHSGLTIAELLTWCIEHNLEPEQVRVTGGHITWESPESAEEVAVREEAQARASVRQEQWERETLARLTTKYERKS